MVCSVEWKKELLDCGKTYYYCNRSGHFHTRGTGQRHIKTQGTSKINAYCTATITVTRERGSECIEVQIYGSHYGHKTALGHLRLQQSDKTAIAAQVAQGVNFQRILDNIRDNLGRDFKRIHLLTRKDITNIERTYVTVHVKKRYKSAKYLWIFHRIPRFLPFCCARSKFVEDDPFHSGDIAAFVPGLQTF